MSTPRTKTGLVPTSHRAEMDRLTSKWSPLPPQPPPEIFPYKGDNAITKKNGKNQNTKGRCERKFTIPTRAQTNAEDEKDGIRRGTNKNMKCKQFTWNANQINPERLCCYPKEKKRKIKSKRDILHYMRRAAFRREKIGELEEQLSFEIALDNKILQTLHELDDETKHISQTQVLPFDPAILREIRDIKLSASHMLSKKDCKLLHMVNSSNEMEQDSEYNFFGNTDESQSLIKDHINSSGSRSYSPTSPFINPLGGKTICIIDERLTPKGDNKGTSLWDTMGKDQQIRIQEKISSQHESVAKSEIPFSPPSSDCIDDPIPNDRYSKTIGTRSNDCTKSFTPKKKSASLSNSTGHHDKCNTIKKLKEYSLQNSNLFPEKIIGMNGRIHENTNNLYISSTLSSCESSKSNRNEVKLCIEDILSVIINL